MGRNTVVWCMVGAMSVAGDCRPSGAAGTKGRYEFFFDDLPGGLVPLADGGTQATLRADPKPTGGCSSNAAAPAFTQVASTDESVVTATLAADGMITIVTGTAGMADLQLLGAGGELVDSLPIEVEPIAGLTFTNAAPAQILAGALYEVTVTLTDATGRTLGGGPGRIEASGTGATSATVFDAFTGAQLEISAPDAGAGTVTATAGNATATLALTAVTATDITSITLATGDFAPSYNPNDQTEVVWSLAQTAAGPVFGADCTWQVDPAVTISSDRPGRDLDGDAMINSQFVLPSDGDFPATCTIGTAQLAITLRASR